MILDTASRFWYSCKRMLTHSRSATIRWFRHMVFGCLAGGLAGVPVVRGAAPDPAPAPARHAEATRESAPCQTPHFAVTHTLDDGAAAAMGDLLEGVRSRYERVCRNAGFAAHMPSRPLKWQCFDRADAFESYVQQEESALPIDERAFYSSRSDTVVLLLSPRGTSAQGQGRGIEPSDVRRISHEAAHQLAFSTGLQTRGVMYPFWISEGLAANLETPDLSEGGMGCDNPQRRVRLVDAYRHGRLCPLEDFLILNRAAGDDEKRIDLYAQAWGAFAFLFNRDPAAFRRYLYLMAQRPHGRRPADALEREIAGSFGAMTSVRGDWDRFLADVSRANPDGKPPTE